MRLRERYRPAIVGVSFYQVSWLSSTSARGIQKRRVGIYHPVPTHRERAVLTSPSYLIQKSSGWTAGEVLLYHFPLHTRPVDWISSTHWIVISVFTRAQVSNRISIHTQHTYVPRSRSVFTRAHAQVKVRKDSLIHSLCQE